MIKLLKKKTKNVSIENALKGLVKDLAFFLWTNTLFDGWDAASQACLIFQPIHRYVKIINNTKYISEWKSKGLSDESIKPLPTSDNSLTYSINWILWLQQKKNCAT